MALASVPAVVLQMLDELDPPMGVGLVVDFTTAFFVSEAFEETEAAFWSLTIFAEVVRHYVLRHPHVPKS